MAHSLIGEFLASCRNSGCTCSYLVPLERSGPVPALEMEMCQCVCCDVGCVCVCLSGGVVWLLSSLHTAHYTLHTSPHHTPPHHTTTHPPTHPPTLIRHDKWYTGVQGTMFTHVTFHNGFTPQANIQHFTGSHTGIWNPPIVL